MPAFQRDLRYGNVVVGNTPTPPPPSVTACFTHETIAGITYFDASCSTTDPGAVINAWSWDFGDGNTSTTGPTVSHTYDEADVYTVTLIVEDDLGNTSAPFIDTVGIGYDDIIITQLDPIWFAPFDALNTPDWLTYSEGIANQMILTGWGDIYAEMWTDEYTGMEWPTFADAISDNATRFLGNYWTAAYWDQSAQPTYDDLVENTIGSIWFAPLDVDNAALPYGGTITTSGGYRYHTFTTATNNELGYFEGTAYGSTVDEIHVGGGGGGGRMGSNNSGGGGGGGEVTSVDGYSITNGQALITIGTGGDGATPANGVDTVFDGNTSTGGGRGGYLTISINGGNGGSGGGGGASTVPASGTGGTGSAGNNGGNGAGSVTAANNRGGGGGGAGGVGGNATVSGTTGTGGAGSTAWHNGVRYGAGGGGGKGAQAGGTGGGGNGSTGTGNANGVSATANTGSGGGGAGGTGSGGNGAGGIAIVRYAYP
jgi:PKD repeat protein